MVNFPTRIPDCDSHSPALLDFFLSSDASICSTMALPPLGNSDHVVVSVSIDFPINSKQDAPFHRIACDYYCANWDGLRDHLRNIPSAIPVYSTARGCCPLHLIKQNCLLKTSLRTLTLMTRVSLYLFSLLELI